MLLLRDVIRMGFRIKYKKKLSGWYCDLDIPILFTGKGWYVYYASSPEMFLDEFGNAQFKTPRKCFVKSKINRAVWPWELVRIKIY